MVLTFNVWFLVQILNFDRIHMKVTVHIVSHWSWIERPLNLVWGSCVGVILLSLFRKVSVALWNVLRIMNFRFFQNALLRRRLIQHISMHRHNLVHVIRNLICVRALGMVSSHHLWLKLLYMTFELLNIRITLCFFSLFDMIPLIIIESSFPLYLKWLYRSCSNLRSFR